MRMEELYHIDMLEKDMGLQMRLRLHVTYLLPFLVTKGEMKHRNQKLCSATLK